jgi:hypothetical protein
MEEVENVARWVRRLGDAGVWFMGDFCAYHHDHPEILFPPDDDRPLGVKCKEIVSHLAGGYGCSGRSIYNWIGIARRWTDREQRKRAAPTLFVQALSMDAPDTWLERAIENGWSSREMLREYKTAHGEEHVGEAIRVKVTAQRYTDNFGKHHLDVQPDPPGLFAFDCKGESYDMVLHERGSLPLKGGVEDGALE